MDYKWSPGSRYDFPKLSVKTRPELVTLDSKSHFDIQEADEGLSPQAWHQYLKDHPQTLVLDARNYYESEIGYFDIPNLVKPPIKTFKEIKAVVEGLPREEPILTYCTGDIRCEYLSAYMKQQGFVKVHHLEGGIMRYGQVYGDQGFWQGKCYVFDKRMQLGFSPASGDLAQCFNCDCQTSKQVNCDDCNLQLVLCPDCQKQPYSHCQSLVVSSQQRSK